ncbi:MAG: hypothetical protein U0746_18770 [Gemmataceae bacterium]
MAGATDVRPDDGTDPRYWDRERRNPPGRKAMQLAHQVGAAIGDALSDCGDDVLRGLLVSDVRPAPTEKRLLVSVAAAPSAEPVTADVVMTKLAEAGPVLRQAVAAAIHRKRMPELVFRVAIGLPSG